MICRKLYHWMIGVVVALLDVGRDEGLPRMSPERVREVVRTVSDRARANDRGIAAELLASHAPPDPRQAILADPRMDGTAWLSAVRVSKSMVDAWPFWEWWAPDAAVVVLSSAFVAHGPMASGQHKLRPLRMAGMDDSGDGVVAATDMAPEHFARTDHWQVSLQPPAQGWRGWAGLVGHRFGMNHVNPEWNGEQWRPAIWAELDKS